ncbi:relaxase/mobilization nuclease domain-containing protein [Streptomyces montanisoli]|uniref:Mobilization protein n=1 Tax=Streptomyces montanisoli TaxID=2798581 RepID=A0A940M9H0_9ACTN|nr:mobilization protein [Streptomyces montanisoli]MBP0455975.1 mobilization protein [Streptomyces montanisoli]
MIAKISSGKSTAGLVRYLFGPGRANEHTDPHLVASWDGFAPDPGRTDDTAASRTLLVADLDLRVKQAQRLGRAPKQHVWHCSLRGAPGDRVLTDDDWAAIARRVVAATGIAPADDPDGCRWIAVRHADDHIHIAATKVRGDLRPARHWNDYLTADKELAAVEKEYGLQEVRRGDRTAARRPTRAEQEKAQRTGRTGTPRARLRATIRTVVSVSASPEEFLRLLDNVEGVVVDIQRFPSGDVRGYKVAVEGDTNASGEPVWFSGSTLAPDLSFPEIRERLSTVEAQPSAEPRAHRRADPWHQATAAAERIPHHLERGDGAIAQAHIAALGEALDALPLLVSVEFRPALQQAAATFERATRSRIRAEHDQARALRGAIRALRTSPASGDGLAMFLDVTVLVAIATARWHRLHQHDQQVAAAQQALVHLQAASQQAAAAPLAALSRQRPPMPAVKRHAQHLRAAVPELAERILDDPAWPALAASLAQAEAAGHQPLVLLKRAVSARSLDDARSPAQTLTWRVRRQAHHTPPSARAIAAQARSTRRIPSAPSPRPPASAAPPHSHAEHPVRHR